jgi:HlyD family secretion protein
VLGAAKVRLTQQVLTAPVDGVVLTRAVEVGSVVQPGLPLLVLAEAGPMRLVIEPDEKNLAALVVGQAAVASADAFPEQRFAARVSFIASGIDPSRGTVEVRLTLDSAQPQLRSDMTVSVEIELRRKADALTLPRAVVRDVASDAPWVMVVDGAHAKKQPVTLGLRGDAVVEVATGLTTDAQVIDPARTLPAIGARVRVAKPGGD